VRGDHLGERGDELARGPRGHGQDAKSRCTHGILIGEGGRSEQLTCNIPLGGFVQQRGL
jgi:hypothetical protein